MAVIDFPKLTSRQVVQQYIDSRKSRNGPISTGPALVALRAAMPDCTLSDRELVDMIAESAILRGRSIAFDSASESEVGLEPARSFQPRI